MAFALIVSGCKSTRHTVGSIDAERQLTRGDPIDVGGDDGEAQVDDDADNAGTTGGSTSGSPDSNSDDGLATSGSGGGEAGRTGGSSSNGASFACSREVYTAFNRRLDMYMMVDSNITLPFTGAWDNLVSGISTYAEHPRAEGTGVGIRFFGLECSSGSYAMPDVEVDVLPSNARSIRRAFPLPFNFSPMQPALEGAIAHARSRANSLPDWKQIVVFVTDGFSTDLSCLTSFDGLVEAAEDGLSPPHPVPTYVVALATPALDLFDPTDRIGPLDDVAAAGATGQARMLDLQDPTSAMVDLLLDIQRAAEPCEYPLPDDLSSAADEIAIALDANSAPEPSVDAAEDCGDDRGFYVTAPGPDDDADAPVMLHACPATCEAVRELGERPVFVTPCAAR